MHPSACKSYLLVVFLALVVTYVVISTKLSISGVRHGERDRNERVNTAELTKRVEENIPSSIRLAEFTKMNKGESAGESVGREWLKNHVQLQNKLRQREQKIQHNTTYDIRNTLEYMKRPVSRISVSSGMNNLKTSMNSESVYVAASRRNSTTSEELLGGKSAVETQDMKKAVPDLVEPRNINLAGKQAPLVTVNRSIPLIWIGGFPRSGTTLMRVMLDSHSQVRCNEETRVITQALIMHTKLTSSIRKFLNGSRLSRSILEHSLSAYILSIIEQHGVDPSTRPCNKDPFALLSIKLILRMFPNSKFVLMVRDPRGSINSMISRKVYIKGFKMTNLVEVFWHWSSLTSDMVQQCAEVGRRSCVLVYYERLVLDTRDVLQKTCDFLQIPFERAMLHHDRAVRQGKIRLSALEPSTSQVAKPVFNGSLTEWSNRFRNPNEWKGAEAMMQALGYVSPGSYGPTGGYVPTGAGGYESYARLPYAHFPNCTEMTQLKRQIERARRNASRETKSRDAEVKTTKSRDAEVKTTKSRDAEVKTTKSRDAEVKTTKSRDDEVERRRSRETTKSRDAEVKTTKSRDDEVKRRRSRETPQSRDAAVKRRRSEETPK